MLLQANKPALADAIWSRLSPQTQVETTTNEKDWQYVLDGGALLHRVPWPSPGSATYREVCASYCKYVTKKYGKAVVVFDGYQDGASTKQMTQARRSSGKTAPTVTFTEDMKINFKKDLFLSNSHNKQMFLDMLSYSLREHGCETHHANGDAGLLIVKTAVKAARSRPTILVGDDTDLLILLLFHAEFDSYSLFFSPEPKRNAKKTRRIWNIKKVKLDLGRDVCHNILFIHAVLGCDTTSGVHGIGKGSSLTKFVSSQQFKENAIVFQDHSSTKETIQEAGENALVLLYNGKEGQSIDDLRCLRYKEKLSQKKKQNKLEPKNIHLHPHLRNITAIEYTAKFKNGKIKR